MSYATSEIPVFSRAAVEAAPKLGVYDSLDAEVIQSYLEFSLASLLFYTLKEGACSEQSSRMTAMDNASKNAGASHLYIIFLKFVMKYYIVMFTFPST